MNVHRIYALLSHFIRQYIENQMSDNCYQTNCQSGCCNYYGYCPEDYPQSASTLYSSCHYKYSTGSSLNESVSTYFYSWPYAVAGGIIGLIVLIVIVVRCYYIKMKKQNGAIENQHIAKQTNSNDVVVVDNNNYGSGGYGGVPNYGTPNYGGNVPDYGNTGSSYGNPGANYGYTGPQYPPTSPTNYNLQTNAPLQYNNNPNIPYNSCPQNYSYPQQQGPIIIQQ